MSSKHEGLRQRLMAEEGTTVAVAWAELETLVGGLPPSARQRTWWANAAPHSQAAAWLGAGWLVDTVRLGEEVVFRRGEIHPRPRQGRRTPVILDGVGALREVLAKAGYGSIAAAVAAHTVFLHPDTVAQSGGAPVFPVARDMLRRGERSSHNGRPVLLDDNTTPTRLFLWAAARTKGRDVQYNHVWADARNPGLYTALWNLCATPAFLAKTTDGSNHPDVVAALRYRSWELYGPRSSVSEPRRPDGYEHLAWPDPPAPLPDLEQTLRARLRAAPMSRPAIAAREIGWLFSGWEPDRTIPAG